MPTPLPGLSRIGPREVLAALQLIQAGRVYDLGTQLGGDMPDGPAQTFGPFRWLNYRRPDTKGQSGEDFQFSMELIMGSPHQSSHIDGLAHIQAGRRIYGGASVDEALGDFGWREHGIETVPPIVGRGVLLDIPAMEQMPQLPNDYRIGDKEIKSALARQSTDVRAGDIVLVRTGKIAEYKRGAESFYGDQPGVTESGSLWLYDKGMAVLGTDTSGTEPIPFADAARTTHRAMIVERGVHLLEILDLDELASDGVYEFMFICTPLKIVGATGSWVRPVAIV